VVNIPDDYDWSLGPYQNDVGFSVGSNQSIIPIDNVSWPVHVLHGSPELENEESIYEVEYFAGNYVDVTFDSNVYTSIPIVFWYKFLRDKDTGIYPRQFPDGMSMERMKQNPRKYQNSNE
jgi:hypothetical protein